MYYKAYQMSKLGIGNLQIWSMKLDIM